MAPLEVKCSNSGLAWVQAMLTPRGRIDGLGWVKHDEDENLENALNALTYPESHNGILHRQVMSVQCVKLTTICTRGR